MTEDAEQLCEEDELLKTQFDEHPLIKLYPLVYGPLVSKVTTQKSPPGLSLRLDSVSASVLSGTTTRAHCALVRRRAGNFGSVQAGSFKKTPSWSN